MEQESYIRYGDAKIIYNTRIRAKDNGKVQIKVHEDGRVIAHAPMSATKDDVKEALDKRARWIWKQLEDFRTQNQYAIPRQYISGESHSYLGKQYMLKVVVDDSVLPNVKLLRGRFQVTVRKSSRDRVKDILLNWYKNRAVEVFDKRLDALLPKTCWVERKPELNLRWMKKSWGSCSVKHSIVLNPLLVKAPRECIDYVLMHELCHIAEHNHSVNFYRLLQGVLPDYKLTKGRLDMMAISFDD